MIGKANMQEDKSKIPSLSAMHYYWSVFAISSRVGKRKYKGRVVLVTGDAIGTNLCRKLAESGARVIILDDLSSAYEWNIPKAKSIVFVKPDYVFHLAAHFANQ